MIILEINCFFRNTGVGDYISVKSMDILPIFEYHNRWKKLSLKDLNFKKKYSHTITGRGYLKKDKVAAADDSKYMIYDKGEEKIPPLNELYISRIKEICDLENIKLVFIAHLVLKIGIIKII